MLRTLEIFVLFAACAVYESKAGIAVIRGKRDESVQVRGIAKHVKHLTNNSKSNMRGEENDFLHAYAIALRQSESHPAVHAAKIWTSKLMSFWKKSSELVAGADTKNGYVSGVLLLQPGQKFLDQYNRFGGVGLVYLSWAGLALGLKDNYDKLFKIAADSSCFEEVSANSVGLTINVLSQGIGLASILGAGPIGGAVFGALSASIGLAGGYLLDMIPGDCDDEPKIYTKEHISKENIDVLKFKELPEKGFVHKTYFDRDTLDKWDKAKAVEVWKDWSKFFEHDYYEGSSYEKGSSRNGLPTYNDPQGQFD